MREIRGTLVTDERDREGSSTPGIWKGSWGWTSLGVIALVFLAAFDALAVTTVMPTIARDLHGQALYSAAFSSTLAAGVIGTVLAGGWIDRRGPVAPLLSSVAVFASGLLVGATAVTMPLFVLGRFLQGLGMGTAIVALLVIVARAYPLELRTRVFVTISAAWVIPGFVGPVVAGLVADRFGWRWVFVGLGALAVVAVSAMIPTLGRVRRKPSPPEEGTVGAPIRRLVRHTLLSVLLVSAVIGSGLSVELPSWAGWPLAAVCVAAAALLIRPLLPRGTLSATRGLGATVLLKGCTAAAFFSTEVRLPYLLQERYGVASWQAGLILTIGAVAWAIAAALQPRLVRIGETGALATGAALVAVGIAVQFATAVLTLHPAVAGIGWLVAAGGMGTLYPRLPTLMLGFSAPAEQGFNSSALTIVESVGCAVAIAIGGLVSESAGGVDGAGFAASILFSLAIALIAVPVALRVQPGSSRVE